MPNQLYRKVVLGISLLFYLSNAWGQEKNVLAPMGIIESIQEVINVQKNKYSQIANVASQNPRQLLANIKDEDVHLNKNFIQSILLFSPKKYVNLIKENSCHFYSLLESGLLETAHGIVKNVIVDISSNDKTEVAQMALADFINLKTQNTCQNVTEIAKIFTAENVLPTFKKISFNSPKTLKECKDIQSDWKKNDYLPFLCGIKEKITLGRTIEKYKEANKEKLSIKEITQYNSIINEYNQLFSSTTLYQRSYISSLCNHLDSTEDYCSLYLSSLVWDRVINAEKPKYYLDRMCQEFFPGKKLTKPLLQLCRNNMVSNEDLCLSPNITKFPQFFPHQDCSLISTSLNISKMFYDYPDCPSLIDSESITNFNRIYEHFRKEKQDYSQTKCEHIPIKNFAKVNIDYQNETAWPLKLCYFDKFEDKEVCETYIPGNDRDEALSEVNIVSQIINKQMSLRNDVKCKTVTKEEYRPQFLEFKNGCFIVRDTENCTLLNCSKKIYLNLKETNLITYKGIPKMEHIPSSFGNEKFSLDSVLKDTLKLSSRRLLNLTMLRNFFQTNDERIVHGVGCLEDLIPRNFKRISLQQCTPHPFIVDGITDEKADTYLVFRSSIEKVNFPRLVKWQYVFNAVSNFREIHPLSTWALYGVNHEKN